MATSLAGETANSSAPSLEAATAVLTARQIGVEYHYKMWQRAAAQEVFADSEIAAAHQASAAAQFRSGGRKLKVWSERKC